MLFLVGTFRYSGGAFAVRFGLWLDQYNLTGFNVAQLFARFFLDGAGIFPLQAIDLVLELLVDRLFLVNLLLKADSLGSLAFVDLHAIGAEDHFVTNEHGKRRRYIMSPACGACCTTSLRQFELLAPFQSSKDQLADPTPAL